MSAYIATRRRTALLLFAVLLFRAVAPDPAQAESPKAEPRIARLSGPAEIRSAASDSWQKARPGMPLPPGGAARTRGGGSLTLRCEASGVTVTIRADSELEYLGDVPAEGGEGRPAASGDVPVYSLPRGKADVSVVPGNNMDLLTPLILTSVRGTRYTAEVAADGSSHVRVARGKVLVADKLGRRLELGAGQRHSLTAQDYMRALRALPKPLSPGRRSGGGSGGRGAGGGDGDDGDDGDGDDGGDGDGDD